MATKGELEVELEQLRKANEALKKEKEDLEARAEAMRAEAKKQKEEKAAEQIKGMNARLDAEPHHWVQVFNKGLDDGVDFGFRFEGVQFKLYSGKPVYLAESVIKHLKGCGHPIVKLKQGEAGQAVKEEGFHHNFNVVNCEAPAEKVAG
jgi:hypothetical protein